MVILNAMFVTILFISVVFLQLNHPISLGLLLMVYALLIGCLTGVVSGSFWFSYVLFLVFLGGVLVLFIYMTSLASNEKFRFNWSEVAILIFGSTSLMLASGLYFLPSFYYNITDINSTAALGANFMEMILLKLYSSTTYHLTLMMVFYLLFALLVCASIVYPRSGALRNFG